MAHVVARQAFHILSHILGEKSDNLETWQSGNLAIWKPGFKATHEDHWLM